jgi:hypothetical protein
MAFFGGMLNAIPYLGPLIVILCSCLFGVADRIPARTVVIAIFNKKNIQRFVWWNEKEDITLSL